VDVSAPGVSILTTNRTGGYSAPSGTSFSSPLVAGVMALIFSANPYLTPAEAEAVLEDSVDDLGDTDWDPVFGHGRVNAGAAVAAALDYATSDTTAPTARITAPTGGTLSGTVSVNVTATDNLAVAEVKLFVNGYLLATDSVSPYQFSWDTTTLTDGAVSLVARATDEAGNTTDSATVTVTVDNVPDATDTTRPVVKITSPADGATVSKVVQITATASDDTAVSSIRLYLDGKLVASGTLSPLSYSWNTRKAAAGTHTIAAVAEDAAGNTATTSITVTVGSDTKTTGKPPRKK
jgi:Big-like domain-containing protein/subtilase family protein